MTEDLRRISCTHREGMLGAVSAGFFIILIGMLLVATPNLFNNAVTFLSSFNVTSPVPNTSIYLPAPVDPTGNVTLQQADSAVYSAVVQFDLIWGVFLIAMLAARFLLHSPLRRISQNASDIVFWLGAAYLAQTMLVNTTMWFAYWAEIIILLGVSLIVRAIFLVAVMKAKH